MTLLIQRRAKRSQGKGEDGYVLMILLLVVALMMIAAAAIVPTIKYEIEHDREEEMIHRGVQYSRAIRAYYKKFGRYPVKIEDLENTSNMRFLRKRYKDPTNCHQGQCEDFKLLHFGEVKLTFGGGVPGTMQPGAPGVANGSLAVNSQMAGSQLAGTLAAAMQTQQQPLNPAAGSDSSQSNSSSSDQNSSDASQPSSDNSNSSQPNLKGFSNQTFGGGPIVGVASKNKKEGYREFNHKKKYSEWQFIYDPGLDRGGLLMTPNQPSLFQPAQNVNGQNNPGTNGTNPSGFGNRNGFGIQSNPSSPATPQPGTPPDANNPEPQQQ